MVISAIYVDTPKRTTHLEKARSQNMILRSLPFWLVALVILLLITVAQSYTVIKPKNGTEIMLDSVEILYVG